MINAEMLEKVDGEFKFSSTHFISSAEKYSDPYLCIQNSLVFRKDENQSFASIGIHINKEYLFEISESFLAVKSIGENEINTVLWSQAHKFQDQDKVQLCVIKDKINETQYGLKFQYKKCSNDHDKKESDKPAEEIDYVIPYTQDIQYGVYGMQGSRFLDLVLKKRQLHGYAMDGQINVIDGGFEIKNGSLKQTQVLDAGTYSFNCSYTDQPTIKVYAEQTLNAFKETYGKHTYSSCFVLNEKENLTIEVFSELPTTIFGLKLHKISESIQCDTLDSFLFMEGGDSSQELVYSIENLDLTHSLGIGFHLMGCQPEFNGYQPLFNISNKLQVSFVNNTEEDELSFYNNEQAKYGESNNVYARYGNPNQCCLEFKRTDKVGPLQTLRLPLNTPNYILKQNWYNKLFFDIGNSCVHVIIQSTPFVKLATPVEAEDNFLYLISAEEMDRIQIDQTGFITSAQSSFEYEIVSNSGGLYLKTKEQLPSPYALFNQYDKTDTYSMDMDLTLSVQENLEFFQEINCAFLTDNLLVLNNESNLEDYRQFDTKQVAYRLYTTFDNQTSVNRVSIVLNDVNPLYPIQCFDSDDVLYKEVYSTSDSNLLQRKEVVFKDNKIKIGDWINISVLTTTGEQIPFVRYSDNTIYLVDHTLSEGDTFYLYFIENKTFCVDIVEDQLCVTIVNPTASTRIKYVSSTNNEDYLHHVNLNPFVADSNNGFIYLTETNNVQQLDVRTSKYILKADGKDTAFVTVKCLGDNGSPSNNFNIECSSINKRVLCTKYMSQEEKDVSSMYAQALKDYGIEYAAQFKNLIYSDSKQSAQEVFSVQIQPGGAVRECELLFKDTISGVKSVLKLEVAN